MGDYADDAIHAGIDSSWGWRRRHVPATKTCKHCGKTGLVWKKDRKFWFLAEEGTFTLPNGDSFEDYRRHSCKLKDAFKKK